MAGTECFGAPMDRINDVLCAVNLLAWDARTGMPLAGAVNRVRQVATLRGLAQAAWAGCRAADDVAGFPPPRRAPSRRPTGVPSALWRGRASACTSRSRASWTTASAARPTPGTSTSTSSRAAPPTSSRTRTRWASGAPSIAGGLPVRDVPCGWAEAMRERPGLAVPSNRETCPQDVHSSSGGFGTFPTHALGDVIGAQVLAPASAEPAMAEGFGPGDPTPLRCGRSRGPARLLRQATGSDLAAFAPKVDRHLDGVLISDRAA